MKTHLDNDMSINCDGHSCYSHNRKGEHKNAPKASGGIAILIKDMLFDKYKIEVIDKEMDGLTRIQLTDIITEFMLVLYTCYLPPANSTWGYDLDVFFAHLLSSLHLHCDADSVHFCGDFNGRVGKAVDIVSGLDEDIPSRIYLDDVERSHGGVLLEFIKDGKLAI